MSHPQAVIELARLRELLLSNAITMETWCARVHDVMRQYKR